MYCVILDAISKQQKIFYKATDARAQVRKQKIGNICNNVRSNIMQGAIIMLITGTYITANAKSSRASHSKRRTVALHSFKNTVGENKKENELCNVR